MALNPCPLLGGLLLFGTPGFLWGQEISPPIRDNSFLIEEAYNQDQRVVQHIGSFTDVRDGGWVFNFTDEWPLGGVRDQLSVGMSLLDEGSGAEFGALALNYRRQVFGHPDAAVVVAPRLSLFATLGEGNGGGLAAQVNLPVTTVLGRSFVSHWNLGAMVGSGPTTLNAGASIVWLALPWMNVLLEGLLLGSAGERPAYTVSPGVRWALNVGSVQVVPGVALPLDLTRGKGDAVLLYLSVEHPF